MGELSKLKGLGPASEKQLNAIGIFSIQDLSELGAVRTFIKLKQHNQARPPSLNFLYALVGALEDVHWLNIAQSDKARLLMELEDFQELETLLANEGLSIEL